MFKLLQIPKIFTQRVATSGLISNNNQSQILIGTISCLTFQVDKGFSKFSRPMKQPKAKERKSGLALTDEKIGKLSQAEAADEKKKKMMEAMVAKKKDTTISIRSLDKQYETKKNQEQLDKLYEEQVYKLEGRKVSVQKMRLERKRQQEQIKQQKQAQIAAAQKQDIKQIEQKPADATEKVVQQKQVEEKVSTEPVVPITPQQQQIIKPINSINDFPTPNDFQKKDKPQLKNKAVKRVKNVSLNSRRTGVLAYKMGMTQTWDKWGTLIPLTVLQVDRCQVMQVKTEKNEGYYSLQIGCGQKNLKNLKKPEIGHYMKANIPPKQDICEFRISPENILPVGYMLSVRHFIPGQFVDITGLSIGKGIQGTIKRHNYNRQPTSHGCSISHRVMGSTGQRQDPSKVFKNKGMPGQMGGTKHTVQNLKVYKIDVARSLIYIVGQAPGKPGTVLQIKDAIKKQIQNIPFLNYPTFIKEEGKSYAEEIVMEPSKIDPEEVYIHDNAVVDE